MIIGIDGNEANITNRVGIGAYAYELLMHFSKLVVQEIEFVIYLKNRPLPDFPKENNNWKYRVIKPGRMWTQGRLPLDLYLHRPRPEVFFSPSHYGPRFSPVPSIISVMDLSFLYFPELFNKHDLIQLKNWTSYSVKKAKKIITISNSSKNDIIKEYGVAPERVSVTYPGIRKFTSLKPHVYGMTQLKTKYKLEGKYILFVGTIQPRKNIGKLIEAFSKLSEKNLDLVIVGKKGWLYEEILKKPLELGIEERVRFLHNVDNDELPILYKNAVCMVLPSLYEGFGLPVLEAMKNECPVVASNVSSLPEAGGDACLYIDPENVDDITDKMTKLIDDEKLRKELIEKGKKQVAKFSWEKTAKETLNVLEEIGGKL
ncbi:MAG TPA: glycosyltransferase family 1 protein [Candidatus Limnocylindrales bacterium]|nr:glycosyltransferase family 1 protein [Candidatus Limnocylindrales bacterium]